MAGPHEILGVDADASEAAIKTAFRRAAKKCHPDMNGGNRAGERRLRRLVAARDFLLRRRHFPKHGPAGHLLRGAVYREWRAPLFAGAFAGAGFLLLLLVTPNASVPSYPADAFETRIVEAVEYSPMPDAGSAEVKAIRDLRELAGKGPPGPLRIMPDGAAHDKTVAPRPASKYPAPRLKRAVSEATATITKTWQRLASRLGG